MAEPAKMLVTLTTEDLRAIVREEVRAVSSIAPDEWMSSDDVARMLGVKRGTIPALVTREGLPCYRPGRGYTFRREEVTAWLRERTERPGARPRKKTLALVKGL